MRYVVSLDGVKLYSRPDRGSSVVDTLSLGETVESNDVTVSRWIRVAGRGHVERRNLRQSGARFSNPPSASVQVVNEKIREATREWDGIRYGMGCKAWIKENGRLRFTESRACDGNKVDCSGWVAVVMTLAARPFGTEKANKVFRTLETHSDGQVVNVGRHTGEIVSGTDIDHVALRAGLIFGIDTGSTGHDTPDRLFGIDHVVAGFHMGNGNYAISQSSGGDGVNAVAWADWRRRFDRAFRENRVHCADLMTGQAGAGLAPDEDGWSLEEGAALSQPEPVFDAEPVNAQPG